MTSENGIPHLFLHAHKYLLISMLSRQLCLASLVVTGPHHAVLMDPPAFYMRLWRSANDARREGRWPAASKTIPLDYLAVWVNKTAGTHRQSITYKAQLAGGHQLDSSGGRGGSKQAAPLSLCFIYPGQASPAK